MGKKRFRPRGGGGGRGTGTGGHYGGGGGGGYYQGSNGQGNGRPSRRRGRRYDPNRGGGNFGGDLAPLPEGQEGDPQAGPQIEGAPPATETPLEPGYGLLEMHPNGYGFLRSPDNTYSRERS